MHMVVLGQATCASALRELPNALGATDQLVPSQCSARVPSSLSPTALQLDSFEHQTALSSEAVAPGAFGLATTFHVVPFQRSIRVLLSPRAPTARQLVALRHFTSL